MICQRGLWRKSRPHPTIAILISGGFPREEEWHGSLRRMSCVFSSPFKAGALYLCVRVSCGVRSILIIPVFTPCLREMQEKYST
jgi:hypothetical protein